MAHGAIVKFNDDHRLYDPDIPLFNLFAFFRQHTDGRRIRADIVAHGDEIRVAIFIAKDMETMKAILTECGFNPANFTTTPPTDMTEPGDDFNPEG